MLATGVSKKDITCFKEGVGMMGYGMYFNNVKGIHTRLFARAFVIHDPESGNKVAIVVAELCFISTSVKSGVIKKLNRLYPELGFHEANVLLSAQHTHSGPGGYSHFGFYNFTIPGFVPEVYSGIVEGITEAIVDADRKKKPSKIFYHRGMFNPEIPVAFNRSLNAYNANPEVENLPPHLSHLGVDRNMDLLRFEDEKGESFACMNWFGVHTTSLSNDNHDINWDNKGYASDFIEKEYSGEFIAAFAQGTAGDVTPNFIWDKKKGWTRGFYEDDDESARFNGKLQADLAKEILNTARADGMEIKSGIDFGLLHSDMGKVICEPEFTGGKTNRKTSPAAIGVEMLAGTREGPGMPAIIAFLAKGIANLVKGWELLISRIKGKEVWEATWQKYRAQYPKHIVIETGNRKVFGTRNVKRLIIPGFLDPTIAMMKAHHRAGSLDKKPWTPQVLPLQMVMVGRIAFAAIPGEITTVAGKRLRNSLLMELKKIGIERVILFPYSNSYCGYITTSEEYMHQQYEAGHTVFGKWTLAAFQTRFGELAREMIKPPANRDIQSPHHPQEFTEAELQLRSFEQAFKAPRKSNKAVRKGDISAFSPE